MVFNSYINAPNSGDERGFFDAKPATYHHEGGFEDVLDVAPGDRLLVRVYIHNNADSLVAKGTELMMFLPRSRKQLQVAAAEIDAENASPRSVSDAITLRSVDAIGLEFDTSEPPQITFRRSPNSEFITKDLPASRFASSGYLTAHLGLWEPGFENGALITAIVRVT
ncbi:MAG: hypothetical protein QOH21_809 [Acidobacteriota bacterium]|nr:hypothetical protein [Acidobacteriota bacterium]